MEFLGVGHDHAKFVLTRLIDPASEGDEQLAHHRHITDTRHVREVVFTSREQARGHLFQHGVLGSVGPDLALEGASGLHDERTHPSSIAACQEGEKPRLDLKVRPSTLAVCSHPYGLTATLLLN